MPVFGVLARSWAMTMADPRMKANGEAIMRAYRIGMRSGKPVLGLRLQEIDRVGTILCRRPRRMACPGDHPTGSAPTFVPLLVTRGRLRRPVGIGCYAGPRSARREVRVSLDFHGFSLTTSGPHAPWSWAARLASRRTV